LQPNFPPGVLQGDPGFSHTYFNMSNGVSVRGPWNEGQGPWPAGEHWQYVDDPIKHVIQSQGLQQHTPEGVSQTRQQAEALNQKLSQQRSQEVKQAVPQGENQWVSYPAQAESPAGNGNSTSQQTRKRK
jgi:Mn-containing catalase